MKKTYLKNFFVFVLAMSLLLSFASCAVTEDGTNQPGETTDADISQLLDSIKKDGYTEEQAKNYIKNLFIRKNSNNQYMKHQHTSPTFYYYFDNNTLSNKMITVLNNLSEYFNDSSLPVEPTFVYDMSSHLYANTQYNSISDRNLASLGDSVTGDFAARMNAKLSGRYILTAQIEIPPALSDYDVTKLGYVTLHELGHAFGLLDVEDEDFYQQSVMYHNINGYNGWDMYYTVDAYALKLAYES